MRGRHKHNNTQDRLCQHAASTHPQTRTARRIAAAQSSGRLRTPNGLCHSGTAGSDEAMTMPAFTACYPSRAKEVSGPIEYPLAIGSSHGFLRYILRTCATPWTLRSDDRWLDTPLILLAPHTTPTRHPLTPTPLITRPPAHSLCSLPPCTLPHVLGCASLCSPNHEVEAMGGLRAMLAFVLAAALFSVEVRAQPPTTALPTARPTLGPTRSPLQGKSVNIRNNYTFGPPPHKLHMVV